jgi:hypothetical protein
MNLIDTQTEIKNSKLLFLLLGMLLILVIGAVDNLLTNAFRVAFSILPMKPLLGVSIAFHGLILIPLTYVLVSIIKPATDENPRVFISPKTLKTIGISFILVLVLSTGLNLYVKTYYSQTIDLSKIQYIDTGDLVYMTLIQSGLILTRNIILFISFFLIIYKQK